MRCRAHTRSSINDEVWGRLGLKTRVWLTRSRALSLSEEEVISVWCRRAAWGEWAAPGRAGNVPATPADYGGPKRSG